MADTQRSEIAKELIERLKDAAAEGSPVRYTAVEMLAAYVEETEDRLARLEALVRRIDSDTWIHRRLK